MACTLQHKKRILCWDSLYLYCQTVPLGFLWKCELDIVSHLIIDRREDCISSRHSINLGCHQRKPKNGCKMFPLWFYLPNTMWHDYHNILKSFFLVYALHYVDVLHSYTEHCKCKCNTLCFWRERKHHKWIFLRKLGDLSDVYPEFSCGAQVSW